MSVTLMPAQVALITVTVSVPVDAMTGTVDTTIISATSVISPTRLGRVVDTTLLPRARVFADYHSAVNATALKSPPVAGFFWR